MMQNMCELGVSKRQHGRQGMPKGGQKPYNAFGTSTKILGSLACQAHLQSKIVVMSSIHSILPAHCSVRQETKLDKILLAHFHLHRRARPANHVIEYVDLVLCRRSELLVIGA
jgi:hypothetical protein